MASVESLGLHRPAGLQPAVDEQLLPANAPASAYSWEVTTDDAEHGGVEDELLTTKTFVVWSLGGLFRKTFNFEQEKEPITQAVLAYFPATRAGGVEKTDGGAEKSVAGDRGRLSKALVVFLKTQAHVHFLSGTSHIVHLPFEVESACRAPQGLIIQRKQRADGIAPLSLRFPRVPPNSCPRS